MFEITVSKDWFLTQKKPVLSKKVFSLIKTSSMPIALKNIHVSCKLCFAN